mgnify:CR=1 FL=1
MYTGFTKNEMKKEIERRRCTVVTVRDHEGKPQYAYIAYCPGTEQKDEIRRRMNERIG